MLFLKRFIDKDHIWLSNVFGVLLHNIGQITVAVFMMGISVVNYLPFLIVSEGLAGTFTRICAKIIIKRGLKNVVDDIIELINCGITCFK